jgi:hypothetical protein
MDNEMDASVKDPNDETDKPGWGGARKSAGRKPLPEHERQKLRNVRMNDVEWEKFLILGGSRWLRDRVRHARLSPDQETQLRQSRPETPGIDGIEPDNNAYLVEQLEDLRKQIEELKGKQ